MKPTRLQLSCLLSICLSTSPAFADLALARSKNCLSCHAVERKIVGPAYKDVAAKYRGDKSAAARLANKIMLGGGGVWGVVKMPSKPQISEAEARQLADWVLSQ